MPQNRGHRGSNGIDSARVQRRCHGRWPGGRPVRRLLGAAGDVAGSGDGVVARRGVSADRMARSHQRGSSVCSLACRCLRCRCVGARGTQRDWLSTSYQRQCVRGVAVAVSTAPPCGRQGKCGDVLDEVRVAVGGRCRADEGQAEDHRQRQQPRVLRNMKFPLVAGRPPMGLRSTRQSRQRTRHGQDSEPTTPLSIGPQPEHPPAPVCHRHRRRSAPWSGGRGQSAPGRPTETRPTLSCLVSCACTTWVPHAVLDGPAASGRRAERPRCRRPDVGRGLVRHGWSGQTVSSARSGPWRDDTTRT